MRFINFCMIIPAFSLTPKNDYIFTRYKSPGIIGIFDVLYKFSCQKSNVSRGIEERRFSDLSRDLWKAREYVEKRKDESMYLGWTPLQSSDFDGDFKFIRNDNKFPPGSEISYKQIPLYFVIVEPKLSENRLFVEKIIHNPSIDVRLDVNNLKINLEELANKSDALIDFSKLKYHDSGRWYFEFFNTVVTPTKST